MSEHEPDPDSEPTPGDETDSHQRRRVRETDDEETSTFLLGETSDGDAWEAYKLDEDSDYGIETTGSAELSDEVATKATSAISKGMVSNKAIARGSTSQQTPSEILSHSARRYIEPPYDPTGLANLAQRSGTHARCVHAKAQGVAGNGFDVVPHEHHSDIDDDGRVGEDEQPDGLEGVTNFWFGRETIFQLGPNRQLATPEEVLKNVWWDFEGVGWGCLEFLVDRTAEPNGLAHVPAHRVRKRVDEPGYVELDSSGQIKQFFSEAGLRYVETAEDDDGDDTVEEGEQLFVDRWTGEVAETRQDVSEVANELLFIQNYSPLTPNYGLPDIVPEIQTIEGDLAARRYNTRFFQNDGVPRFVVSVEGGELTDRGYEDLQNKLKELSTEENAHRGILIEAVSGVVGPDAPDVSVNIEPLTVGEQEDASFIEFRRENEHDIIKAHSVPPVVVSRTEGSNYANSREQRQEFAQETVRPRQSVLAARLHRTLHTVMLDSPGVTLEFALHGGENRLREATIAQTRLDAGAPVMKVNEAREELGYPPLETENGEPDPLGERLVAELQAGDSSLGLGGDGDGPSPPTDPTETPTENMADGVGDDIESEMNDIYAITDGGS